MKWLGKDNSYTQKIDGDILDRIQRHSTSTQNHIGVDIWMCYEVSWLTPSGKPIFKVAELRIPANSRYTVESKSLKLYLNHFNMQRIDSESTFKETVIQDISNCIQNPVEFILHNADQIIPTPINGRCLDHVPLSDKPLKVSKEIVTNHVVYTHLFRSTCPVTAQPDWASIVIKYTGHQINESTLLTYLLDYRDHQGFHESCIEKIYTDINNFCNPTSLEVVGVFSRRGGISIQPIRKSQPSHSVPILLLKS